MMLENVTKTYKKCNTNKFSSINFKAKQIANKLKTDDRVQKLDKNEAYITIKDHKGKINKQILDRVSNTILVKNKVKQ